VVMPKNTTGTVRVGPSPTQMVFPDLGAQAFRGAGISEARDPGVSEAGLDPGDPQTTGGAAPDSAPPQVRGRSGVRAHAPDNGLEQSRPSSPEVQIDSIPFALLERQQWVGWRYERHGTRWTKVPYRSTGAKAKSTDPSTWSMFDDAFHACRRRGYDGVGFVVSPDDPFVGVDLDDCLTLTGEPEPWAAEVVALLDSFTEVTPSGDGVRVWAKGRWNARHKARVGRGTIEVYDRSRYFTVTGRHLKGTPAEIEERQDKLDTLAAIHFASKPKPDPRPAPDVTLSIDDELLRRARAAANGAKFTSLFDQGDWKGEGYTSQSEADLALCAMLTFWTGPDPARVDALFRASALYRDKWDREDYRNGTLGHALELADSYDPHHRRRVGARLDPPGRDASIEEPGEHHEEEPRCSLEPLPAFMKRVASRPPPRMLVEGLVPEDAIMMFHGQPRAGKTLAVLELLLAMATGTPAFGLERLCPLGPMPVGYVGEEDSERRTWERLRLLLSGRGLNVPPLNLHLSVGHGVDLDDTGWQQHIIEMARKLGLRFLAFDPLRGLTARADQGPAELRPVAHFLRCFQRETGCAVGLVHHDTKPPPGKPDTRTRPQRASGGGIFSIVDAPIHLERIDASRTMLVPSGYKFSEDPMPLTSTFRKDGPPTTWIRLDGEDTSELTAKSQADREAILAHLQANPWISTSAVAQAVKKGREKVTHALERLRDAGDVEERPGPNNARLWHPKEQAEEAPVDG